MNDLFHREIEAVLSKYEPPCDDSSSKGSVAISGTIKTFVIGSVQDDAEQEPDQARVSSI